MTDEIKLAKLESFSFDLDGEKLQDGMFSWSGNYVAKLRVDPQKKKVFVNLYYANINYRINKSKKKNNKEVIDVVKMLGGKNESRGKRNSKGTQVDRTRD